MHLAPRLLTVLLGPGATGPAASREERAWLASPTDVSGVRLAADLGAIKGCVLIFHGAGGPDRETANLQRRVEACDRAAGLERYVAVFDWTEWLGGSSRAAFDGQAVGKRIGEQLAAEAGALRSLHVIGTSVGGFAADATVSAYVGALEGRNRARVHLTLTDPFTSRGNLKEGWGMRNFGRTADYAEHYLNTDDLVPSTNEPLPLCYVYDVTRCAERRDFRPPSTGNFLKDLGARALLGHNWPMGYLARHYEVAADADGGATIPSHEDKPRGQVTEVF